jgi:hypothetical protein
VVLEWEEHRRSGKYLLKCVLLLENSEFSNQETDEHEGKSEAIINISRSLSFLTSSGNHVTLLELQEESLY